MPQAVSIQINVEDNGVVAAINQITGALERLGAAGSTAGLRAVAGTKAMANGLKTANRHITTGLDSVRLLSQEFGFRMPRAMEAMLSRIPAVTNALTGMIGVMASISAAEIFVHMGEEIYNAEEKYFSITAAADKYNETLQKISEHDFTNTRDLATTALRLRESVSGAILLPRIAQQMHSAGMSDLFSNGPTGAALAIGELYEAHKVADKGALAASQRDELTAKQTEQMHEQALEAIELEHAKDGLLQKDRQANAEAQKAIEITAENRSFANAEETRYGNPVDPLAGQQEDYTKNQIALAEAAVKNQQEAAQESLTLVKAQNEARQAGLQGEALYSEKLKDSVQELLLELTAQRELEEYSARKAALEAQYDADRQKRVRELTDETARLEAESKAAGLTGAAKIMADRDSAMAGIDAKQRAASGGAPLTAEQSNDFDRQRAVVAANSYRELNKLEDDYTSHVEEQTQQRADALLSGYAKIDAAAAREKSKLQSDFDAKFGGAALDPDRAASLQKQLNDAKAAVDADAQQQKQTIQQRNQAEDLQFEQQAAAAEAHVRAQGANGMASAYRNAMAEIQAQESARLAKLRDDAQKEGLTWQEVAQRHVDIEREANAEIVEQNQHMVQSLAGELQSAFDNPMKFLKDKAEKAMFEIIANWMMQTQLFKDFFGGSINGLQPGGLQPGAVHAGAGVSGGTAGAALGMAGVMQRVLGVHGTSPAITTPGFGDGFGGGGVGGGVGGGGTLTSGGLGGFGGGGAYGGSYSGTAASPSVVFPGGGRGGGGGMSTVGSVLSDAKGLTGLLGMSGAQASAASAGEAGDTSATDAMDGESGSGDPTAMQSTAGGVTGASGMAAAMNFASLGMGAYQGVEGAMTAFHTGGLNGALQGTMSGATAGAAVGSMVMPGLGTVIGGAAGAVAGLATNLVGQALGESGRFAARDYYYKTLYPEMEGVRKDFMNGGGDYLNAVSEANRDAASGMSYMTAKWGPDAAAYVNANYLQKELTYVTSTIERMARGGSEYTARASASFHTGGIIGGFGDLSSSPSEGYIHAAIGEGITNVPATQMHGAAIQKMNDGATPADMAAHYLQATGAGSMRSAGGSSSGGDIHIHTLDTKTMTTWLRNGGARMISAAQNAHIATYGGSASNG